MSKKTRGKKVLFAFLFFGLSFFSCSKKEKATPHTKMSMGSDTKMEHKASNQKQGGKCEEVLYWYDPMHPWYRSDKPGKAPDCGMDLVPKCADEEEKEEHLIAISPQKQQLIGIKLTKAKEELIARKIRTVGIVAMDENRISAVQTKYQGYVERAFVNQTGNFIHRGQPLFTVYSPDLVSTQEELLLAKRAYKQLRESAFEGIEESSRRALEAARQRLRLWDITLAQIEKVERTGEIIKSLTVYAPRSGYIFKTHIAHGMTINPGMVLYEIADLSVVWILADLYEQDIPFVKPGQKAVATLDAYPGKKWTGKVSLIYPFVEEKTRTNKARIVFPNPKALLKPGMYASVEIHVPIGRRVTVPETAVMETGERQLVFVKKSKGAFEPREVVAGVSFEGKREILSGLKPGEEVVTAANFLLDSESRLKEALGGMHDRTHH